MGRVAPTLLSRAVFAMALVAAPGSHAAEPKASVTVRLFADTDDDDGDGTIDHEAASPPSARLRSI